jgi:hypothetical protein
MENGAKSVKVVLRSVSTGPKAVDGKPFRTRRVYEKIYAMVGSKPVNTRAKDISMEEEKVPLMRYRKPRPMNRCRVPGGMRSFIAFFSV